MNYSPKKYVIKVPGGWAVLPFDHEALCTPKGKAALGGDNALSAEQASKAVADVDVSVVFDKSRWDVIWTHGSKVTPDVLNSGQIV